MNKVSFPVLASIFAMFSLPVQAGSDINCSLKMTNDYVSGTFMMSETAASIDECKSKCREYGDKSIKQMADPAHYDPVMKVLSYECLYNGQTVEQVDYTKK